MLTALPFVAAAVFWALLHRESRTDDWGYVGRPPTDLEVALRALSMAMARTATQIGAALLPAMQRVTRACNAFAAQLGEAFAETFEC